mmetsp:Transcript_14456/g.19837  ORF Transcript_14456/g.19837 Transcript_14456/m.19837 type:complete len:189 (+) Transcript_14456:1140-1706(+)
MYGRALLFGEELPLDNEVMSLIANGVFTNSITKFRSENMKIIPQTSIIAMTLLPESYFYCDEIRLMVNSLLAYLKDSDTQNKNSRRPLEIVLNGLINARLVVLSDVFREEKSVQEFSLLSLLRLDRKEMKRILTNKLFDIIYGNSFIVNGTSYETIQMQFSSYRKYAFPLLVFLFWFVNIIQGRKEMI